MRTSRPTLPAFAFVLSLVIHGLFLIALPWAIEAAAAKDRPPATDRAANEVVMILPPEEDEPEPEVELGLDAPTPPTDTWIGHEEPEPQLAEQFEIEQAAFVDEPVAAAPPPQTEAMGEEVTQLVEIVPGSVLEEVAERDEASPQSNSQGEDDEIDDAPDAEESKVDEIVGKNTLGENEIVNTDPMIEPIDAPDLKQISEAFKQLFTKLEQALEDAIPKLNEKSESTEAKPLAPGSAGGESPAHSHQSPSEAKPQIAPQAQDAPREIGTPADMESSPTSIIDIPPDQWQLGKPLARQGLQLKPRRPDFTLLTLMTASPGNPRCEIKFGRDGVPVEAAVLRSSSDKRVDDAILASLFRWRAEGEQLKTIAQGQTLNVQIRIVLNRRAAAVEDDAEQSSRHGN